MSGGRRGNQPAVQTDGVAAGEPDIFKGKIKMGRCLYNGFVGKKDLLFNKPFPTTAKKAQSQYPKQENSDS